MISTNRIIIIGSLLFSFSAMGNEIHTLIKPAVLYSNPPGDTPNHKTGLIEPGVIKCKDNVQGDQVNVKDGKRSSKFSGYVFVKILSGECKDQKGYLAKWYLKK